MLICSKCKKEKNESDFHKNAGRKTGYNSYNEIKEG